jgi:hypothetical protein
MQTHQDELIAALEPILDKTTLADLLLALSRVCDEKSDHILASYDDSALASVWERRARQLGALSVKIARPHL